jgi:hypothetical protein
VASVAAAYLYIIKSKNDEAIFVYNESEYLTLNLFVSWILSVAPGVAGHRALHASNASERRLNAPEAAAAERYLTQSHLVSLFIFFAQKDAKNDC